MEFVSVGKIVKPHGLKGEVFVRLKTADAHWTGELKEFQISKSGKDIIWTNEKARPHKDGVLIKPKELTRIEEAEEFRGFEVKIPNSYFTSKPGENFYLSEVLGFSILDQEGRNRGEIVGFEQISDQDLAKVKCESGTYLLPFSDANTVKKDWDGRAITMKVPDGIESLNL